MDKNNVDLEKKVLFLNSSELKSENKLNRGINFLKFCKAKDYSNFTYISTDSPFINKLTIEENINLNSIKLNLIKSKTDTLKALVDLNSNKFLKEFVNTLGPLNIKTNKLLEAEITAYKVFHGLLKPTPYCILSEISDELISDQLRILKDIIKHEALSSNKVFIIIDTSSSAWEDIITDHIQIKKTGYELNKIKDHKNMTSIIQQAS